MLDREEKWKLKQQRVGTGGMIYAWELVFNIRYFWNYCKKKKKNMKTFTLMLWVLKKKIVNQIKTHKTVF